MYEPDPMSNRPPPQTEHAAAATFVCLPDFYADYPPACFFCIEALFAASKITASLTKFNWALSQLPFSLIDSIGPLCKHPSSYRDPYQELQDILLRSYGLSIAQRTSKWLDYPGCGSNRPSVMLDNLTALQPPTVKEIQTVLFIQSLPRHIRNLINRGSNRSRRPSSSAAIKSGRIRALKKPPPLRLQQPRPRPPRDLTLPSEIRGKGSAAHRPPAHPEAATATACVSTTPASVPRPRSARRAAHTRKTNRPPPPPVLSNLLTPPPPCTLGQRQSQPCLSYLQRTSFSCRIQRIILNFLLIQAHRFQSCLIPARRLPQVRT
jgi:hypothetical protein